MNGWTIAMSGISVLFSALAGFAIWRLQRVIVRREEARTEHEVLAIKGTGAAIALGEAVAIALRDGHTNGETEAALKYAREVKHAQKDFLAKQAVLALH